MVRFKYNKFQALMIARLIEQVSSIIIADPLLVNIKIARIRCYTMLILFFKCSVRMYGHAIAYKMLYNAYKIIIYVYIYIYTVYIR